MQRAPTAHSLPVSFAMLETNASLPWLPASCARGAEEICLSTRLAEEQHVGKGGSAVCKPEMERGGFFSGDFNFVYSDKTGFQ